MTMFAFMANILKRTSSFKHAGRNLYVLCKFIFSNQDFYLLFSLSHQLLVVNIIVSPAFLSEV